VWIVVAPAVLAVVYLVFLPLLRKLRLERIASESVAPAEH